MRSVSQLHWMETILAVICHSDTKPDKLKKRCLVVLVSSLVAVTKYCNLREKDFILAHSSKLNRGNIKVGAGHLTATIRNQRRMKAS